MKVTAIAYPKFAAEFLALYVPPHRRKATWFKLRKVLDEFAVLPGIRKTTDLTPQAIVRWLHEHRDRAPMTNKSYLGCLRAACNYGKQMGYLAVTPWDVRREWVTLDFDPDDPSPTPRHLNLEEIGRLLARVEADARDGGWQEHRLQALISTYLHTGLRKAEALGLRVEDVHLERRVIRIRPNKVRRLKTRTSERLVGIPDDLAPVLGRWIARGGSDWLFPGIRRTKPWLSGGPGRRPLDQVKAAGIRAGIPHTTIHALRRSLATASKALGMGPLELKDLLGHGSTQTQDWYLEDDATMARERARRIRFPRPEPDQDQGPPAAGAA